MRERKALDLPRVIALLTVNPARLLKLDRGTLSVGAAADVTIIDPDLEWTVLCPSMMVQPGERTGKFRVGLDDLITAADGSSRISVEDYAVAFVDELEMPEHLRQRFTVGY